MGVFLGISFSAYTPLPRPGMFVSLTATRGMVVAHWVVFARLEFAFGFGFRLPTALRANRKSMCYCTTSQNFYANPPTHRQTAPPLHPTGLHLRRPWLRRLPRRGAASALRRRGGARP
eukprot:5984024-Pleurochrysis_carterae.AAC.1